MNDHEKAALIACLLDVLEGADEQDERQRLWPSSGHPHIDSTAWNPRGPSAYRLAGRVRQHRSRRIGRT